ncbi:MAG TPA: choline ABC transporter ATP-binding protein [Steroidobacteraceae bacterium]|nr:choline ABC transporter ATP-binding protein [Steroidobacteraceae bacterium]
MSRHAIDFQHVDILFSREQGRKGRAALRQALESLDAGGTRAQIAERFGVVVGVADANLSVESGHISVLMGLSGSGKSTLLRAANGLNPVSRGRVLVRDGDGTADVATCTPARLRQLRRERIAMVFQQFGLLPWRTVRDNVGFGLELRGENASRRAQIVDEKLELVGLSQWAGRHVSELSGGMQQRVGLARAFATDADILLMDEPFSALDPLIRTKLQDELLALQARVKKTIVFVSHDLDEALRLGNQISVLEGGRILQTGSVQDIVLRPAHARVSEFVQHMNPLQVLSGDMVMRPRGEMVQVSAGGARGLQIDAAGRYLVRLDADGRPQHAILNGLPVAIMSAGDTGAPAPAPGLLIVPVTTSLQRIVELCARSGHPVLLQQDGQLCGACGEAEILRALAGSRGATVVPGAVE